MTLLHFYHETVGITTGNGPRPTTPRRTTAGHHCKRPLPVLYWTDMLGVVSLFTDPHRVVPIINGSGFTQLLSQQALLVRQVRPVRTLKLLVSVIHGDVRIDRSANTPPLCPPVPVNLPSGARQHLRCTGYRAHQGTYTGMYSTCGIPQGYPPREYPHLPYSISPP